VLLRRAILSIPKLVLTCAVLCIASLSAVAETKPVLSVDPSLGIASFKTFAFKACPYHYPGYLSLEWLDTERMAVFSTSPVCAKKEGVINAFLELVTFDLRGNLLHSADISYEAGVGTIYVEPDLRHDGVWIGPDQTVMVEFRGGYSKTQPDSRGKILVLSSKLLPQQEIENLSASGISITESTSSGSHPIAIP